MFKNPEHTIALLHRLQAYITNTPETFNLGSWGSICDPKDYGLYDPVDFEGVAVVVQQPKCGAVGCLAGNLCILTGLIQPSEHFGETVYVMEWSTMDKARDELQLSEEQADRLFFLKGWGNNEFGWPEDFSKRLRELTPGTSAYVAVTVERINRFIETEGDE